MQTRRLLPNSAQPPGANVGRGLAPAADGAADPGDPAPTANAKTATPAASVAADSSTIAPTSQPEQTKAPAANPNGYVSAADLNRPVTSAAENDVRAASNRTTQQQTKEEPFTARQISDGCRIQRIYDTLNQELNYYLSGGAPAGYEYHYSMEEANSKLALMRRLYGDLVDMPAAERSAFMTPEAWETYYGLLGSQGGKAAMEYYRTLRDDPNARKKPQPASETDADLIPQSAVEVRAQPDFAEARARGVEIQRQYDIAAQDLDMYLSGGALGYTFTYDSPEKANAALEAIRSTYGDLIASHSAAAAKKISYMSDAEWDEYYYRLGSAADKGGSEYSLAKVPELHQRQGQEEAEEILERGWLGEGVGKATAAVKGGLDGVVTNIGNMLMDRPVAPKASQYKTSHLQENSTAAGRYLQQGLQSAGAMIPTAAAAAIAGPGGAALVTGLSAAGGAYGDALSEGYSKEQAKAYAVLIGISEAILDYSLGLAGKASGVTEEMLLKKVSKLSTSLKRFVGRLGVETGTEIVEEEAQLLLEPLIRKLVFGEEYDAPNGQEMLDTAIVAFLSTLFTKPGKILRDQKAPATADTGKKGSETPSPSAQQTPLPQGESRIEPGVVQRAAEGAGPYNGGSAESAADDMMLQEANRHSGKKETAASEETTGINTDPAKHTKAEQAVIDDYQKSVDEDLVKFYDEAGFDKKQSYSMKPVSERAAKEILEITGNDVSGFKTTFDARQAAHIKKDHGADGKSDRSMADSNDVGRIQYVLDHYDSVEDGGTTDAYWETKENGKNRRARTVVFSKKVNGTYYVVEAAPVTKAKSLYVVTAYMQKNRTPQRLLDANASQFTSETSNADSVLPDNSLSHIVEKSKEKIDAPAAKSDPAASLVTPPCSKSWREHQASLQQELDDVNRRLFALGMDDPYGPEPADTKEGRSLLNRKAELETQIAEAERAASGDDEAKTAETESVETTQNG